MGAEVMSAKFTTRKYQGDDALSWALFKDGYPILTGLSQREARYYRDIHKAEEADRQARPDGQPDEAAHLAEVSQQAAQDVADQEANGS